MTTNKLPTSPRHPMWMMRYAGLHGNMQMNRIKSQFDNKPNLLPRAALEKEIGGGFAIMSKDAVDELATSTEKVTKALKSSIGGTALSAFYGANAAMKALETPMSKAIRQICGSAFPDSPSAKALETPMSKAVRQICGGAFPDSPSAKALETPMSKAVRQICGGAFPDSPSAKALEIPMSKAVRQFSEGVFSALHQTSAAMKALEIPMTEAHRQLANSGALSAFLPSNGVMHALDEVGESFKIAPEYAEVFG